MANVLAVIAGAASMFSTRECTLKSRPITAGLCQLVLFCWEGTIRAKRKPSGLSSKTTVVPNAWTQKQKMSA